MRFGLKNEVIDKLKGIFELFPEVEEAVIYGSRAKGSYKAGSDIDITLKGRLINLTTLNKISEKVDDLFLPYIVDISLYDKIHNRALTGHINRAGVLIYKKPATVKK